LIAADRSKAAIVRATGCESDREARFIPPTILDFGNDFDAFQNSKSMQREIFGPLLPLVRYTDFDQVMQHISSGATSGAKPLSSYLFTTDPGREEQFKAVQSGVVVINDCMMQLANPNLPWGGVGESGHGKAFFRSSRECFSHSKSVMTKKLIDLPVPYKAGRYPRFPPYVKLDEFILNLVMGVRPRKFFTALKAILFLAGAYLVYSRLPSDFITVNINFDRLNDGNNSSSNDSGLFSMFSSSEL